MLSLVIHTYSIVYAHVLQWHLKITHDFNQNYFLRADSANGFDIKNELFLLEP